MAVSFDKRFFDRWYRDPRHQVRTAAELRRQAALAVAMAEEVLDRPIRSVLDIGAGEGAWRHALRALRPRIDYLGIEPSEYAVRRFGARRQLRQGTFGSIGEVCEIERYDLVVCVDVIHYLEPREVVKGITTLGAKLRGVALLQVFAREDVIEGDVRSLKRQTARWYRSQFRAAGLSSLGIGFWAGPELSDMLSALELPG